MNFDRQVSLTSCLLLYQNRQDKALGLEHITVRQRGLLWYYGQLQTDITTKAMTAGYLNGIIQQSAAEIKTLVKQAEQAKDKHKIARRVVALQEMAQQAAKELERLETPTVDQLPTE